MFSLFSQDLPAAMSQFGSSHSSTTLTINGVTKKFDTTGKTAEQIHQELQAFRQEMENKPVEPATFANLAASQQDEHTRAYYTAMSLLDVNDVAGRQQLMTKFKQQPYGLIIEASGICNGFERRISTSSRISYSKGSLKFGF